MKRPYSEARAIADSILAELSPHCDRIEIAGSIRRKCAMIGDVEIVAIPKPYDVGLFETGIATVVERWEFVKGTLPCKYTQRIHPSGMKVDLFFAIPDNWGLILAMRTGSADYSHHVLARRWVAAGYKSVDGMLTSGAVAIPIREELELFSRCGMAFAAPEERDLHLPKEESSR